MKADLHIHTTASDGRYTPTEILRQAREAGLRYIAITDHDTVDGLLLLEQQENLAPDDALTLIPGIEFSTDLPGHEVHILGYHIDIHQPELSEQLTLLTQSRRTRTRRIVEKLVALGFDITYQEVLDIAGAATSIGRAQISKTLVAKGYFPTVGDVFEKLLATGGPAYVPHDKLSPASVIALIKKAGGVAVLAHPGLVGDNQVVLAVIQAGIDGLEVYHPRHDAEQIEQYLALARRHRLLVTGGSDFHGIPGRFPETLGIVAVPASLAEHLCSPRGSGVDH